MMETYKSDKAEQPSPSLENLARRQHIAEQDLKDARLDIEYLKSAVEPKPVEPPMTRARIEALGPEELRERVALDILALEVRPAKAPIDRYGEPEYWGWDHRGLPVKAFQPDVRGDHCFDVIEVMQELGFALDKLTYSKVSSYRWLKSGIPVMEGIDSPGGGVDKTAILQAALCAIHRV